MSLTVHPLSYACGAEIAGVDISKPLDAATIAEIRSAFLKHCVVLFRNQTLTRAQHVAFSRQFGEVDNNEGKIDDIAEDCAQIMIISNKPVNKKHSGIAGK